MPLVLSKEQSTPKMATSCVVDPMNQKKLDCSVSKPAMKTALSAMAGPGVVITDTAAGFDIKCPGKKTWNDKGVCV